MGAGQWGLNIFGPKFHKAHSCAKSGEYIVWHMCH